MVWDVTAEVNAVPLPRWLDTVHGPQRGSDERQIRGIGSEGGCQLRVDGRGAHPYLELRRAGGAGVEVDGRAGFPRDQIERDFMVGADDSGHLVDGLPLGPSSGACIQIDDVATDPAALPGGDGDGGEGSTFVLAGGLVSDGFVGPALAGEHRMLGFDVLVRDRLPTRFG